MKPGVLLSFVLFILGFIVGEKLTVRIDKTLTSKICFKEGFFRNPYNCEKFYRCVDWTHEGIKFTIFQFDCPAGTTFDESIQTCNFPWNSLPCNMESDDDSDQFSEPFQRPVSALLSDDNDLELLNPITGADFESNESDKYEESNNPSEQLGMLWTVGTNMGHDQQSLSGLTHVSETGGSIANHQLNPSLDKPLKENESANENSQFTAMEGSLYNCQTTGFYPHEDNCVDFYVCLEVLPGVLLAEQVYSCPDRYLFDELTRRCQRENKVSCRKSTIRRPDSQAKETVLVVLEEFLEIFFNARLSYRGNDEVKANFR